MAENSNQANEMKRYDMIYYVQADYCNPNGDPDLDNMPRTDPEGYGLMTPQSLKRKIRDYLSRTLWAIEQKQTTLPEPFRTATQGNNQFNIYIRSLHNLKLQDKRAELAMKDKGDSDYESFFLSYYYDVRAFGAVLTKRGSELAADNQQLVGPIQVSFGRSLRPVEIIRVGLTATVSRQGEDSSSRREQVNVKNISSLEELDAEQRRLIEQEAGKQRDMGRMYIVKQAVYKFKIAVDPFRADEVGFDQYDLALFVRTLLDWPDQHKTSSKFGMSHKKLFIFEHSSRYGNLPIWELEKYIDENSFTIRDDMKSNLKAANIKVYEL